MSWCLFAVELLCLIHLSFPTCWSVFHCETPIILHSGRRWITEDLSFSRVHHSLNHCRSSTGHPPVVNSTSTPSSARSHAPPAPVSESGWVPEPREREGGFFESLTTPTQHMPLPRMNTHTLVRLICTYRNCSVKEINSFNQIPSFILIKQSSRHRNANMPEWRTSIRN